jgi:hypothetical protein
MNLARMSAQLVKKFKRADPSRAELAMNRASQRATSISSSPSFMHGSWHAMVLICRKWERVMLLRWVKNYELWLAPCSA